MRRKSFDELNEREIIANVIADERYKSNKEREEKDRKLYLGEIFDIEKPEISTNNLFVAPVGSGKSYLIEERLIPKDYTGTILYLASNTALKDSIAPNNNNTRKMLAEKGFSKGFFTTQNKKSFGDVPYKVHVMTYHEFGSRIFLPHQTFTKDIDLIFCDEIHSLPIYNTYSLSGELHLALNWLFQKHENKTIFYFTATMEGLDNLNKRSPGYTSNVKVFNYLDYPNIMQYKVKSTYYISNIQQLRLHLKSKKDYIDYTNRKGLAFTKRIEQQEVIAEIAKEEGYTPIVLWSVNNDEKELSPLQIKVRNYILRTGNIPEPYNLLIINSSMQEGWNLFDKKVEFAILDTTNETERVQALGRIRKDIDFLILKTDSSSKTNQIEMETIINLEEKYLNRDLTQEEKQEIVDSLNLRNERGKLVGWPSTKKALIKSGYEIKEKIKFYKGKRKTFYVITNSN